MEWGRELHLREATPRTTAASDPLWCTMLERYALRNTLQECETAVKRGTELAGLLRRRISRPKRVNGQLKTQKCTFRCMTREFRCHKLARAKATTMEPVVHRRLLLELGAGTSIGQGKRVVGNGAALRRLTRRARQQPAGSPGIPL